MNTDSSAYGTLNLANFIKNYGGANTQAPQLSATSSMTPSSQSRMSGLLNNRLVRWVLIAVVLYGIWMFLTQTPRGRRWSRSLSNRLRGVRRSLRERRERRRRSRQSRQPRQSESLETNSSDRVMEAADEHYKQLLNKYH